MHLAILGRGGNVGLRSLGLACLCSPETSALWLHHPEEGPGRARVAQWSRPKQRDMRSVAVESRFVELWDTRDASSMPGVELWSLRNSMFGIVYQTTSAESSLTGFCYCSRRMVRHWGAAMLHWQTQHSIILNNLESAHIGNNAHLETRASQSWMHTFQ
ncbi:hypothetical protein BJX62DRAFT_118353 [Aspergillus germanicus]